jgi:hypothetical protein
MREGAQDPLDHAAATWCMAVFLLRQEWALGLTLGEVIWVPLGCGSWWARGGGPVDEDWLVFSVGVVERIKKGTGTQNRGLQM